VRLECEDSVVVVKRVLLCSPPRFLPLLPWCSSDCSLLPLSFFLFLFSISPLPVYLGSSS